MKEYLNFVEQPSEGRKTKRYKVFSKAQPSDGHPLGIIYYKPTWRTYVFWSGSAEYDFNCMLEITEFLNKLKQEREEINAGHAAAPESE